MNYPQKSILPQFDVFANPASGPAPAQPNYPAAWAPDMAGLGRVPPQSAMAGLAGLGQANLPTISPVWLNIYRVAAVVGLGAGAYHGYKRNNSVGWAIGWGLLGSVFPFLTIPVSLAQGYGKPKRG